MAPSKEAASMAQPSTTTLPFPPEIRDRIYKLVLTSDLPVLFSESLIVSPNDGAVLSGSPGGTSYFRPGPRCLSILLVSKQVCLEAFHIFYRHNSLYFSTVQTLAKFLIKIGYARRIHITQVAFPWNKGGYSAKEAFHMLRRCPNLESVHVHLNGFFQLDGASSKQFLREVRGLNQVEFFERKFHNVVVPITQESFSFEQYVGRHSHSHYLTVMEDLKAAMMRPRLAKYTLGADEKIDPFKPMQERYHDSGVQILNDTRTPRRRQS